MECNGCTLCCKLLRIPWMDSPEGEYCRECEPEVGCKIWENRPEGCRLFGCSYYRVEKVNKDLKPQTCGVVFEKVTDTIFLGTIDPEVLELSNIVMIQIKKFLERGFSVILNHLGVEPACVFNTENRTSQDVWKEFQEVKQKIYGSSNI